MPRRSLPEPPGLRRSVATRELPRRVAIFCEGKTEKVILQELRGHWRVAHAQVEVVGQVGAPRTVVDAATDWQHEHRREKPVVVVVFDRDEHETWVEALHLARERGLVAAVSNPCVELWGILLHQDHSAWTHRHDAQRSLARLHPRYDHGKNAFFDLPTVLANLGEAERREKVLLRRAEDSGDPFGNPTTRFSAAIATFRPS